MTLINHFIIPLLVVLPLVLPPLHPIDSQALLLLLLDSKEQVLLLLIPLQVLVTPLQVPQPQLQVLQPQLLVQLLAPSQPIQVLMVLELLLPILILTVVEALIQLGDLLHIAFQPTFQHVVTVLIQA